jgi:NADH-quinone oxidoreductase subunit F
MSTAELSGTKFFMNFPVTDTSHTLAEYRTRFGYQALEKALGMSPSDVTKEVAAAGLLGHGGAAFPAGRKWGVVKLGDGEPHYVCMNADEGEPGTFKDRWLMEYVPHMSLEGLIIGSYALQGRHAFIYIRGEFDLAYRRMAEAIEEAYAAGLLGENILGTGYSLDVVLYRGAGSYVCGEASAMLASLEGKKGWPRNRPPRLTVKGLYQKPTVVNNVETLANVPVILRLGAAELSGMGRRTTTDGWRGRIRPAKAAGEERGTSRGLKRRERTARRRAVISYPGRVSGRCSGRREGRPGKSRRRR